LEFSLVRTPLDLLLQPVLTLFIWLRFNFISLLDRSCINLMFPCTKRCLTWSKEVSLSCPASLPKFLLGRATPYPISFPDAYPDSYPRLCSIPYPSSYPELYLSHYPSRTQACYPELYPSRYPSHTERVTQSFTRVLPGHVPDWANPALPERLLGQVKSYPITYPALPEDYPAG
jgi:hypothetical protein